MFCKKCGKELQPNTIFCPNCGERVEERSAFEPYGQNYEYNNAQQYQQQYQQPYQQNFDAQYTARKDISNSRTLGIISIILGVLGVNLIGWICGGIGLSMANRHLFSIDPQIQHEAHEAKKLNTIGIVITSVVFFIVLITIFLFAIGMAGVVGSTYYY